MKKLYKIDLNLYNLYKIKMEEIITSNKYIYIIKRINGETNDYFYEKAKQIKDLKPLTSSDFNRANQKAQIQCNKKYYGCSYD